MCVTGHSAGATERAELTVGTTLWNPASFLQHRQQLELSVLPPVDSNLQSPQFCFYVVFFLLPFSPLI